MNALTARILTVQDTLPREFRKPVSVAADMSDGTFLSFQQELAAQSWDCPELPVQEILDKVSYDFG